MENCGKRTFGMHPGELVIRAALVKLWQRDSSTGLNTNDKQYKRCQSESEISQFQNCPNTDRSSEGQEPILAVNFGQTQ